MQQITAAAVEFFSRKRRTRHALIRTHVRSIITMRYVRVRCIRRTTTAYASLVYRVRSPTYSNGSELGVFVREILSSSGTSFSPVLVPNADFGFFVFVVFSGRKKYGNTGGRRLCTEKKR